MLHMIYKFMKIEREETALVTGLKGKIIST